MKVSLKQAGHWAALLLVTDLVFLLTTWLIRPEAMRYVFVFLLLFTAGVLCAGCFLQRRRLKKRIRAAEALLEEPEERTKQALLSLTGEEWAPVIESLYRRLTGQAAELGQKQLELQNYREYIEAWVHELKTPLSLLTLVLENHREEMSPYVYSRMEHVRKQVGGDAEQILFYARLQADHADYRFTRFRLDLCGMEAVKEFSSLAEEKGLAFLTELAPAEVVSDRKVLSFLLSQLLSNAVKYAPRENGRVAVMVRRDDGPKGKIRLFVRDNGAGAPPEDAPFLFDKGFTGRHPSRQRATGMGLYLVKKYADALGLEVRLEEAPGAGWGFGIELVFPVVL